MNSVNTWPRTRTTTRSQIRRSSNSSLARSKLAPVVFTRSARDAKSSSLDATSTPRVGVMATISFGLAATARATDNLLLIAARELFDRLVESA